MDKKYALAFDFGATSIRAILGKIDNGHFSSQEVMRFNHKRVFKDGRERWDFPALLNQVVNTIKEHAHEIASISINTWGVDFALINKEGELVADPISYRDEKNQLGFLLAQRVMSSEDIFLATGNQIMNINTLFQLLSLQEERKQGVKLLMMPDIFNYLLSGKMTNELTIASTSQLLDLNTKEFSYPILEKFNLSPNLFSSIIEPTNIIGSTNDSLIDEIKNLNLDIKIIACASHDTASAVLMTEAYTNQQTAFLSCGTWSLIGGLTNKAIINLKAYQKNLTNELGFLGTNMFFKNITGLYILERLKDSLEQKLGHKINFNHISEFVSTTHEADDIIVDVEDPLFADSNVDVIATIDKILGAKKFTHDFVYFKIIYQSLAHKYAQTLKDIQEVAHQEFKKLHLIGGGSQSEYLCQLVANKTKLTTIAGPQEATAYGNLLAQFVALKQCNSLQEGRDCILQECHTKTYYPQ